MGYDFATTFFVVVTPETSFRQTCALLFSLLCKTYVSCVS